MVQWPEAGAARWLLVRMVCLLIVCTSALLQAARCTLAVTIPIPIPFPFPCIWLHMAGAFKLALQLLAYFSSHSMLCSRLM